MHSLTSEKHPAAQNPITVGYVSQHELSFHAISKTAAQPPSLNSPALWYCIPQNGTIFIIYMCKLVHN